MNESSRAVIFFNLFPHIKKIQPATSLPQQAQRTISRSLLQFVCASQGPKGFGVICNKAFVDNISLEPEVLMRKIFHVAANTVRFKKSQRKWDFLLQLSVSRRIFSFACAGGCFPPALLNFTPLFSWRGTRSRVRLVLECVSTSQA